MNSGARLSELIADGPLPTARLLAIASALAETVEAAHARGEPFGALAPTTVFVTDGGDVYPLDAAEASLSATRAGDLRALGALLYVLATGHEPYGRAPSETAMPRSPIELNPRLPSGLVQLIQRGVDPQPEARFAAAAEVAAALREVRRAPGSLDSLLPAEHVSSSSRVKPPPRPAPGERDIDDEDSVLDEPSRGLPFMR